MIAPTGQREFVRLSAPAMGTRFECVLAGGDLALLRAAGEAALAEVCGLSDRLSAFSAGSVLSYINANAAKRAVAVDREVFELLSLCREGWLASEGAFDVTVGPLMEAWGFCGRAGSAGDVARARQVVGMDKVRLDAMRGTVRFACEGVRLDLGGVAKGWALDVAARVLREAGVVCALMHGGTSSVVAIGSPENGDGWRVRVGDGAVTLRDRSLSVSAPRGRMIQADGRQVGHVLDPRAGSPVGGVEFGAAVCAEGVWAEVWSTALLVLGRPPAGMPGDVEVILGPRSAGIHQEEVCA